MHTFVIIYLIIGIVLTLYSELEGWIDKYTKKHNVISYKLILVIILILVLPAAMAYFIIEAFVRGFNTKKE